MALIRNSRPEKIYPIWYRWLGIVKPLVPRASTVHPRPDRHARYDDIPQLKEVVTTELNVGEIRSRSSWIWSSNTGPISAPLVPDAPGAMTSSTGWNTVKFHDFLADICPYCARRADPFIDLCGSGSCLCGGRPYDGADQINFYTGHFARQYTTR
ncbi:MAG: pyridoxine 5'-phosphate synthase [Saprospiraceae bacterium]